MDGHRGDMAPMELLRLEELLGAAFAMTPSPAASARMDGRVAAAIALRHRVPVARPGHRPRFGLAFPSRRRLRLLRPLALGMAGLALVGAGAAYVGLFEPMLGPVKGWHLAWDRAARPGIVQIAGPYTVTLERAYADTNRVLVGVSVVEAAGATPVELAPDYALTDAAGHAYGVDFASGNPEGNALGTIISFLPDEPLAAGPMDFTLTIRLDVSAHAQLVGPSPGTTFTPMPGPITFHFRADVAAGGVALASPPDASETASGYTITLESASISATMVRARLRVEGPPLENLDPTVSFALDGRTIDLQTFPAETVDGAQVIELSSLEGFDHATGTATLRVISLRSIGMSGSDRTVVGPWSFTFAVPGR